MCESIFAKISTLKKSISLIFLFYLLIILFADVILQKRFCTHLKLLDVQIEDNKDNNCNVSYVKQLLFKTTDSYKKYTKLFLFIRPIQIRFLKKLPFYLPKTVFALHCHLQNVQCKFHSKANL